MSRSESPEKKSSPIPAAILWDESHMWGVLVRRALDAWNIPAVMLRAGDIPDGPLKKNPPKVLFVPGGFAARKSAALGEAGRQALRDYVAAGGTYVGFCGGAGLALSDPEGLRLCPWRRKPFRDRFRHLASGHVRLTPEPGAPPELALSAELPAPVWWPGRLDPDSSDTSAAPVHVLARYGEPEADFQMADLRLAGLPGSTLADWKSRYGVDLTPDFLRGLPCVITGAFGRGRYLLSYAHLETPASPPANGWLAALLTGLGLAPVSLEGGDWAARGLLPPYDVADLPIAWDDDALVRAIDRLEEIISLGGELLLLYPRAPWLLGWRRGLPGGSITNLWVMLREAASALPSPAAQARWRQNAPEFTARFDAFADELRDYLLAERLAMTVASVKPGAVPDSDGAHSLETMRRDLFGPPPGGPGHGGGKFAWIMERVEAVMA